MSMEDDVLRLSRLGRLPISCCPPDLTMPSRNEGIRVVSWLRAAGFTAQPLCGLVPTHAVRIPSTELRRYLTSLSALLLPQSSSNVNLDRIQTRISREEPGKRMDAYAQAQLVTRPE